jgi:hypothetical protein
VASTPNSKYLFYHILVGKVVRLLRLFQQPQNVHRHLLLVLLLVLQVLVVLLLVLVVLLQVLVVLLQVLVLVWVLRWMCACIYTSGGGGAACTDASTAGAGAGAVGGAAVGDATSH